MNLRRCENAIWQKAHYSERPNAERAVCFSLLEGSAGAMWEPFAAARLSFVPWWSRGCEEKPSRGLADPVAPHPLQQGVLRQPAALSPLALSNVVAVGRVLQLLCLK